MVGLQTEDLCLPKVHNLSVRNFTVTTNWLLIFGIDFPFMDFNNHIYQRLAVMLICPSCIQEKPHRQRKLLNVRNSYQLKMEI